MRPSRLPLAAILALVVALVVLRVVPAQPPAGSKYALLVGLNEYDHDDLKSLKFAENDVTELKGVLEKVGYRVTLLTGRDATKTKVETALRGLVRGIRKGDTLVVGLAGHGLQFEGDDDSYFCPIDGRPFKDRVDSLVSVKWVYDRLQKDAASGPKFLLVDACRNDPKSGRGRGIDADTAPNPPRGVGVLLSCSAGEVAWEHQDFGTGHGAFFHHVIEGFKGRGKDDEGNVTWDSLRAYVKRAVSREVPKVLRDGAKQTPEESGRLAGAPPVLVAVDLERPEEKTYTSRTTGMKFVRIKAGTFTIGSTPAEIQAVNEAIKKNGYNYSADGEGPRHEVTFTHDYLLGVYAVTRGEFRTFIDDGNTTEAEADGKGGGGWDAAEKKVKQDPKYTWRNAGFPQTDRHPVVNVSWNNAKKFAAWLSRKDGREYRLPTEAEWEYACRAGKRTRFWFGDDEEGLARNANAADADFRLATGFPNGIKASDGHAFTAPVGSYRPNPWGLYDTHGNVYQWCEDWYGEYSKDKEIDPLGPPHGSIRVRRGGCWGDPAGYCRSAFRLGLSPEVRSFNLGFRLALVPSAK